MGLHLFYHHGRGTNITGLDLYNLMVTNVSFSGVSGDVAFNSGGIGSEAYGRGDRVVGLEYQLVNFDPKLFHAGVSSGATALANVGTWLQDTNTFTPCDQDTDALCSSAWVFNTVSGEPPVDQAPVVEQQMNASFRVALRVLVSISYILVFFFGIVLFACQDHPIMKLAQPNMLYLTLLGALLACVRVTVVTFDLTDNSCIIGKWLGHISFALVFGAMILKTWRVNKVVNSGMKRVKISMRQLHMMMGAVLLLLCFYLAIDTYIGKPHKSYDESYDGRVITRKIKCINENQVVDYVLFGFEFLALCIGARMCWATKDVPSAVNDSKYIAMCEFSSC